MFKILLGSAVLFASLAVIIFPIYMQRKEDDLEYNREKLERIFARVSK